MKKPCAVVLAVVWARRLGCPNGFTDEYGVVRMSTEWGNGGENPFSP